jgi:hypothetical protein
MTKYTFEDLPLSHSMVHESLEEYNRPNDKISHMTDKGELIPLIRGYYALGNPSEKNLHLPFNIANTVYGVSYISRYSALSYYGLLTDGIQTVESVTTKRSKVIDNKIGRFSYHHISDKVFHIGIRSTNVSSFCTFLIASPEKALCDLIWTSERLPITSYSDMIYFLEEDQRIDLAYFAKADREIFEECLENGTKPRLIKHFIRLCKEYRL